MTFTHTLTRRTCEAPAVPEVNGLHSFGEYDLVDGTCEREGEVRERKTVRNEGRRAAESQNVLNKYDLTHPLNFSRTCEALAVAEVHGLHAFGEHDLVDSACGREGKGKKKEKV